MLSLNGESGQWQTGVGLVFTACDDDDDAWAALEIFLEGAEQGRDEGKGASI